MFKKLFKKTRTPVQSQLGNFDALQNKGISFFGDYSCVKQTNKTLIVLGVARGGTSLISGTLDKLGIFTGERSAEPVYEDMHLSTAIETGDFNSAKEIIDKYNQKIVWSYKRPSFIEYADKYHEIFTNPIYLVIFKDIFSIANRNNISMKQDLLLGLKKAQKEYATIIDFLSSGDKNYFMFSYEKIMENKEKFVDTIMDICGKNEISNIQKQNALKFIEPNSKQYLNQTRNSRSIGRIELINNNIVKGWGKYLIDKAPVIAELYINDEKYESQILNQQHPNQKGYLFEFDISKLKIEDVDKISVKLSEDILFLNGSQNENTYEKQEKPEWFNQHQLNNMAEGKYKEADFLRDIAVLLKNRGDTHNAYKLICKALELRPNGPFIQKFKKEMEQLL